MISHSAVKKDKMFKSTNMKKPLLNSNPKLHVIGTNPLGIYGLAKSIMLVLCLLGTSQLSSQSLEIVGDSSVCGSEILTYSALNTTPGGTLSWALPNGGGTILTATDSTDVDIEWGTTPGQYTIRLTETSMSGTLTVFYLVTVEGNFAIACNNLVQVSVDYNCEAVIDADIMLESPLYPNDSYTITVFDQNGQVIPNATVTSMHIGKVYNVNVTHDCAGNTCWGRISVEDKWIPELTCGSDTISCGDGSTPDITGFPFDTTVATIIGVGPGENEYTVANWDKCSPIQLRYTDQKLNKTCDDEFYSVIYRTWFAEDNYGNTTSCIDTIMVERGDISEVMFPENFDGIVNPYLECNAKTPLDPGAFSFPWNALPNGNPSPSDYKDANGNIIYYGTGLPSGTECDHLATTFTDVTIDVCGGTFKVLRKWRVLDWCTGAVIEGDQLIKVIDNVAPIAICPPIDTVGTDYYVCNGTAKVQPPIVFEECSSWSYTILHKPSDNSGNPDPSGATDKNVTLGADGFYYINDLPVGRSWIVYIITDACGNSTECVTEIDVLDDDNPVAVCDEHTVVTLNEFGNAELFATSVDQGSFDNCELDSFAIRRMTTNCNVPKDLLFGEKVELCCEDVSESPIMVVFRVWDIAGNYNDCMVEVTVQDKIAPTIDCPANITIDCDEDYTDLDVTGRPNVVDECGNFDISFDDDLSGLNDCNIGTIRRRFIAEDESGRFSSCNQSITLVNSRPFGSRDISWPRDRTLNGCSPIDGDPSVAGRPIYQTRQCVQIAASYHDDIFTDVQDICVKIVRKWTVIDWCQYDVNNPQTTPGKWEHYQTIIIDNNVAPDLDVCDDITVCADQGNCTGLVNLVQFASDDCTAESDLEWRFMIDLFNDNTVDSIGYSNDASGVYPIGTHKIIWYAIDECGNEGTCTQLFEVRDCKQPTPYCEVGLITVIMPSTGEISVSPKSFDAGSFDDCTPSSELRFSFTENLNDTIRSFTCDSLEGEMQKDFTVMIWVTDASGNQDFCTTLVRIQANRNSCPGNVSPVNIKGSIKTVYNKVCPDVEVGIAMDHVPVMAVITSSEGEYLASNLEDSGNYRINPKNDRNHMDGVSTADLVRIQKHILGLTPITNPYGLIAADINKSNSISAKDLVALRKLILGIDNKFAENTSWRFVDVNHHFEDPANPWFFPEEIVLDSLRQDYSNADFYAVKIGDVSGNTNLGNNLSGRSNDEVLWVTADQTFRADDIITVPVYPAHLNTLEGVQFTLNLQSNVELLSIESGSLNISEENIGYLDPANGIYSFVWYNAAGNKLAPNEAVLTFKLRTKQQGMLSNSMEINSRAISASAVISSHEVPLNLVFRNSTKLSQGIASLSVDQNYPNPFQDETVIPVRLSENSDFELIVTDLQGRVLLSKSYRGSMGLNNVKIEREQLQQAAVLFYTVKNDKSSVTKKMVLSE